MKVSAVAETLHLVFLLCQPWPKHSFYRFHAFGRGRNSVFAVFYSSAAAESRFSPFSRFQPRPTSVYAATVHKIGVNLRRNH